MSGHILSQDELRCKLKRRATTCATASMATSQVRPSAGHAGGYWRAGQPTFVVGTVSAPRNGGSVVVRSP